MVPASNEIGGYEYRFVSDPPDTLVCKICHHPCREPYLSGCCGHNFCKTCLDSARKTVTVCPYCRNEEFVTLANKLSNREIRSLHVMCTNKERGCEWQGELNNINNHLENTDGCQFKDVKCFNDCGKILQRRYLTSHVEIECPRRKVDCQYCHITGEHQFIEGEHKEHCPKLPLPCPNKCKVESVPREDMEAHRKKCPLEEVNCSLKCGKKLQQQYLTNHVETECPRRKIDCQYCHVTGEHQFIEGEHKKQCPKLPLPCPNKCEVGSVPRKDMDAHRKECPYEIVHCEYHDMGCEERMMHKDLEKHKKEKMEKHLALTSNQLLKSRCQLDDAMNRIAKLEAVISSTAVYDAISRNFTQWTFQLVTMITSKGNVMPITVKLSEFENNPTSKREWYLKSDDKGYMFGLSVYTAGNSVGKGTHLSVFFWLMKGPHDDDLKWPLREKFELKLLNQISDCEHHSVVVTYDDQTPAKHTSRVTVGDRTKSGWGCPQFISHEDLRMVTPTCQYLKDDCIFLQVSKQHT